MEKVLVKAKLKKTASPVVISRKLKQAVARKVSNGIVQLYVRGISQTGNSIAVSRLIQLLQEGLPVQELDDLCNGFDLPMEKLVRMLGISKATLHRRKITGRLDPSESDRVLRFARLLGKAVEVLESLENARKWLASSQIGLSGAVPLEYAETEVGVREVEELLGRIEYGVYS